MGSKDSFGINDGSEYLHTLRAVLKSNIKISTFKHFHIGCVSWFDLGFKQRCFVIVILYLNKSFHQASNILETKIANTKGNNKRQTIKPFESYI